MRRSRRLLRGVLLCSVIAAACGVLADQPTPQDVPERRTIQTDEDAIEQRLRACVRFDVDYWIKRSQNNGALFSYKGEPTDYRSIANHLVVTQYLDPKGRAPSKAPRSGSWCGDNPNWQTFDEGCEGKAMALLASLIIKFGNSWSFQHPTAGKRTMLDALNSGVECTLANQFTTSRNDFPPVVGWQGVPGPWPQSPGWRTGEAKFPPIAGLRTYNDGATSENAEGLAVARFAAPRYRKVIDQRILLCAEGTWWIQQQNQGGVPEQADAWGVPAWGRGFEPPAISPRATAYALDIYALAHAVSGDDRWLERVQACVDFLDETHHGEDRWQYFLEPSFGLPPSQWRPVWGDSNFNKVYDPSKAHWPTSYRGQYERYPAHALARLHRYLETLERKGARVSTRDPTSERVRPRKATIPK